MDRPVSDPSDPNVSARAIRAASAALPKFSPLSAAPVTAFHSSFENPIER